MHGELTGELSCCRAGATGHLGAVSGSASLDASIFGVLVVLVDANSSGTPDMKICENVYIHHLSSTYSILQNLAAFFVHDVLLNLLKGYHTRQSNLLELFSSSSCHQHNGTIFFSHLASVTARTKRVRRTSWLFIPVA